jgi:hypothetical protein
VNPYEPAKLPLIEDVPDHTPVEPDNIPKYLLLGLVTVVSTVVAANLF